MDALLDIPGYAHPPGSGSTDFVNHQDAGTTKNHSKGGKRMSDSNLRMTVASWADREDLVIELTTGEGADAEDWGLVTFDPELGKPVVDLYPRLNNGEWHFDLEELSAILALALEEILEAAGPAARDAMRAANAELQTSAAQ